MKLKNVNYTVLLFNAGRITPILFSVVPLFCSAFAPSVIQHLNSSEGKKKNKLIDLSALCVVRLTWMICVM